jgi:hypothetical protein
MVHLLSRVLSITTYKKIMAKRSKINGSIVSPEGIISLEMGKIYLDSIITDGVDEALFEDVSDEALEIAEDAEVSSEDEAPKKKTRKAKSELE